MGDKIAISAEMVKSIVTKLREDQEKIIGYKETLCTELDAINKAWEGADATLYTDKMRDDYSLLLEEFGKCLESYIDFLDKVYDEYKKFDAEYAGKTIEV